MRGEGPWIAVWIGYGSPGTVACQLRVAGRIRQRALTVTVEPYDYEPIALIMFDAV